ncbi:YvcK family protein [Candidatus Parcubacteria bacterium]|nr:YvcK family protein [Candidatus Parcubacteria bacterium]
MKNVVVIGGGTGIFTVLSGLKKYPVNLSAIVSMADDGGSTKILMEEFGILPPGSVRPALIALSNSEQKIANLFNHRFSQGNLKNHNFGNLLITALSEMYGDFEKAIAEAGKLLNIKGAVIPSTLDNACLFAQLENGKIIKGETNIDIPKHNSNLKIENVFLKPECKINKRALQAITKANLIIIGPGDLYTSIIPNLLVKRIPQVIQGNKAKKIYICNLMTKLGETNNFNGQDFIETIEKYLGKDVLNYVIFNNKKPSNARVVKYEKEKACFVEYNPKQIGKNKNFQVIEENFLRTRGFIRHDSEKLAKTIMKILFDED